MLRIKTELPTQANGQHPNASGLFFNGYEANLSGQMRLMRFGARSIAGEVKRQLAA